MGGLEVGFRGTLKMTGKDSELALGPSREAGGLGTEKFPSGKGGEAWHGAGTPLVAVAAGPAGACRGRAAAAAGRGGAGRGAVRAGGPGAVRQGGCGASRGPGWMSARTVAAAAPGAAPLPALPPELVFCPAL